MNFSVCCKILLHCDSGILGSYDGFENYAKIKTTKNIRKNK